jgi:hypothetical protein
VAGRSENKLDFVGRIAPSIAMASESFERIFFQPPKAALRAPDRKILSKHGQPLRSTAFSDRSIFYVP